MAYYNISTLAHAKLLLKNSSLLSLAWPPGYSPRGFAYWLFAWKAPIRIDTYTLAELVDEFWHSGGDCRDDVDEAKEVGATINEHNANLVRIARIIREVRSGNCGLQVLVALGRIATSVDPLEDVRAVEPELCRPLVNVIDRLADPVRFLDGGYVRGRDAIVDALVAGHIPLLDQHLARRGPWDGTDEVWDLEVSALSQLVANSAVRSLADQRATASCIGEVSHDGIFGMRADTCVDCTSSTGGLSLG